MKNNIKLVNSVEDLKGLKKYAPIQYTCRKCGKTVVRQFYKAKLKIISRFLCRYCNVEATNRERYGVKSTLSVPEVQEKIKETLFENYGVDHPCKSKEIQERIKQTIKDRYGVENSMQSKMVKEKAKATLMANYGVDHPSKSKELFERAKAALMAHYGVEHPCKSKEILEKAQQTFLEKYGVKNPKQNKEIQQRIEQTNLAKYGSISPFGNKEVQEKSKQTIRDRYGVEHAMQSPEIREKATQTNLRKYGCENYSQTKEAQQNRHCRYSYDGEKFDSSWELALWIYAKDHGESIERVYEPFEYVVDGKTRCYYPDFKYKGRLVEVKGEQFISNGTLINPYDNSQNDIYNAKHKCIVDNGVKIMHYEDMIPYINYCKMKYEYKRWYYMYTMRYMWLQWLYNYSSTFDFTPFSMNVFVRDGMEFVDCECSYE